MENEIKKENFASDSFSLNSILNSQLEKNSDSLSDIFYFKLNMIQREFQNEIDITISNLSKFCKTISNDMSNTGVANQNLMTKIDEIGRHKLDNNKLEKIIKTEEMKFQIERLENSLMYIHK